MTTSLSAQFDALLAEYGQPDGVQDAFAQILTGIPVFP